MLLVFDCTVMIDLSDGGILPTLEAFSPSLFICDVNVAELEKKSKKRWKRRLRQIGVETRELPSSAVIRVLELAELHPRPSRNDLFALALAEHLDAILLTGDADLRRAAEAEGCRVHGTLWLLDEMVRSGIIEGPAAAQAVERMLAGDRRLPAQSLSRYQKAWGSGCAYRTRQEDR